MHDWKEPYCTKPLLRADDGESWPAMSHGNNATMAAAEHHLDEADL